MTCGRRKFLLSLSAIPLVGPLFAKAAVPGCVKVKASVGPRPWMSQDMSNGDYYVVYNVERERIVGVATLLNRTLERLRRFRPGHQVVGIFHKSVVEHELRIEFERIERL